MSREIDPNRNSFSKEWWKEFEIKSKQLSIPLVVENVLKEDRIQDLKNGIYEMLQNLSEDKNFDSWRVWVDGKQDHKIAKSLIVDPIKNEVDLISWQKRNFGDKKFGIILNEGQKYSDKVQEIISTYFNPFFENNAPFGGLNFSIFIGNYGWTPIGIHEDHTGSFVMHFHLGPGEKTMYMWEKSNYKKNLEGKDNDKDPNKYLVHSDYECNFKKGDVFFMPWNYYHIGKSDELSLGLTVWVNYNTIDGILNGVWENGLNEIKKQMVSNENVLSNLINIQDTSGIDFALSQLDEELLASSINDFLLEEIEDYTGALISNNWYDKVVVHRTKEKVEINENTKLVLNKYKIHYSYSNETIKIFHMGNKVSFHYHEDIKKLLESLNIGNSNSVKNILLGKFTDWPEGIGRRFLEILYENDIIQVIEE
jgi:hypothetical protein